ARTGPEPSRRGCIRAADHRACRRRRRRRPGAAAVRRAAGSSGRRGRARRRHPARAMEMGTLHRRVVGHRRETRARGSPAAGLTGFRNELRLQLEAERREDPDSPAVARIARDLRNLDHLRTFALPVIERLASWPAAASWGEWLDRFVELAPTVLSRPERVQA